MYVGNFVLEELNNTNIIMKYIEQNNTSFCSLFVTSNNEQSLVLKLPSIDLNFVLSFLNASIINAQKMNVQGKNPTIKIGIKYQNGLCLPRPSEFINLAK